MTSLFVVLLLVVVAGWSPLVTSSVLVNLNCDNLIEQVQSASREDVRPLEDNTGSVLMKLYDDCIRIIAEGRGVVREPLGITRKGKFWPKYTITIFNIKYNIELHLYY